MGPSFKYKDSIKLMSDRLVNTASLSATMTPIIGGDNWNMTIEFSAKGEEKQHGEGFGIWLS